MFFFSDSFKIEKRRIQYNFRIYNPSVTLFNFLNENIKSTNLSMSYEQIFQEY